MIRKHFVKKKVTSKPYGNNKTSVKICTANCFLKKFQEATLGFF